MVRFTHDRHKCNQKTRKRERRRFEIAFHDLFLLFTRPRFLILHGGITITLFSDENGNIPKLLKKRVERGENIMNKIAKIAALAALALTSYILC